jgi:hypothetical protein
MLGTESSSLESTGEAAVKSTGTALVPIVAAPRRLDLVHSLTRPDPSFITHLIAMAELSPQTRLLRRAAPEDVQAAYRSVANQNRIISPPGLWVRQVA